MSKKHFQRFNENFECDNHGKQFIDSPGHIDLESMNVIYTSLDTIRQLYTLHLDPDFIQSLDDTLEAEISGFTTYDFAGHTWALRRGGKSGYQFMLQNAEEGLIILVKSRYATADTAGTHLKFELSPKLITEYSPSHLQLILDNIADLIALDGNYQISGIAPHLAVDFQGWIPPNDLNERMTCRSKRVTGRHGYSELVLDTDVCAIYGNGQSFLFGSANTLQCAVYNKSLESKASDKLDFFRDMWGKKTSDFLEPVYDEKLPVFRVEMRFHHSVIDQFSQMNQKAPDSHTDPIKNSRILTIPDLIKHLGGLWAYAMNNFRLDYNSQFIAPQWSLLAQDSDFTQIQDGFLYRRKYKTAGVGNEKNVSIALGNLLSIYARNQFTSQKALYSLKNSGIYRDVVGYFRSRGLDKADIKAFIEDGLNKRRLTTKLAA